ncbi:MAG: hypothetical protein IH823_05715 [Candidatus Dadabacteria bacterium]|nr:hypothetical protein [Candidatus Dadabacteria bacterium]
MSDYPYLLAKLRQYFPKLMEIGEFARGALQKALQEKEEDSKRLAKTKKRG